MNDSDSYRQPRITVVGSINMDLVITCARLPQPGETIMARSSAEFSGGKGANQAVAAARAGGQVHMVGRVGDDAFGERLRTGLEVEGINCSHVQTTTNQASGLAVIGVESSGQNSIMVVPGANGQLTPADVQAADALIRSSDILLIQLEVPMETVLAAIQLATASSVRTILDPAPAVTEFPESLLRVNLICPNEHEAGILTGLPVTSLSEAEAAARELHRRGAESVVITMGHQGAVLFNGTDMHHLSAHSINAVDTTAAGDAFAGALAVRWAQTSNLLQAVRFGNAAGALASSVPGAQNSLPQQAQIEEVLNTGKTADESPR